jgi:hypothetical protein
MELSRRVPIGDALWHRGRESGSRYHPWFLSEVVSIWALKISSVDPKNPRFEGDNGALDLLARRMSRGVGRVQMWMEMTAQAGKLFWQVGGCRLPLLRVNVGGQVGRHGRHGRKVPIVN